MKNKIKKVLSLILSIVMVLSLFGCSKKDNTIDETNDTTENNEIVGTNQESNSPYAEDQVLFYAQNKYHLEEDSHIIHFYNYKGELLSSNDTSRMNSFYVPSYHKSGLTPAIDFITGKCGVVNEKGEFVVEPKYENMWPFSKDGLALVAYETEEWNVNVYGYINTKGEEVIPCTFDCATSFYESGLAIVGVEVESYDNSTYYYGYKYGVINTEGEYILEPQFVEIYDIEGEYIICFTEDYKYVLYNHSGDLIYKYDLDDTLNDSMFYINGKVLLNKFNDDKSIDNFYIFNGNEFVQYNISNINVDTRIIYADESGRGCGVSYKDKIVIPCEYQDIIYVNGYYIAENSYLIESYDVYNENFEKTAEGIEYDLTEYTSYSQYSSLPEGYFYIIVDDERDGTDMYGIIDYTGKIIVEPVFSDPIKTNTYEFTGFFRRSNL